MILLLIAMAIMLLISLICMLGGETAAAAAFGSFSALYGVLYLILKDASQATPKLKTRKKGTQAQKEARKTAARVSSAGSINFVRGLAIAMAVGLSAVWFFGFLDKAQISLALLVSAVYALLFLLIYLIYLIYRRTKKKENAANSAKPNADSKK